MDSHPEFRDQKKGRQSALVTLGEIESHLEKMTWKSFWKGKKLFAGQGLSRKEETEKEGHQGDQEQTPCEWSQRLWVSGDYSNIRDSPYI